MGASYLVALGQFLARSSASSTYAPLTFVSLLLCFSTLAINLAGPYRSNAPHILAEFLCWATLWLGSLLWSRVGGRRLSETGSGHIFRLEGDSLAWLILATIAARQIVDINWALPLVTPILHFHAQGLVYRALPTRERGDKVEQGNSVHHGWNLRVLQVALIAVALGSAAVLVQPGATVYSLTLSVILIGIESRLLLVMGSTENEHPSHHTTISLFDPSTAGRVAAGLFFMMLLAPGPQVAPTYRFALLAALKAVRWLSLLALCRSACTAVTSTVSTFGAAFGRITQSSNLHGALATSTVAVLALIQTHFLMPRPSYRLVFTGFVTVGTLVALLQAPSILGIGSTKFLVSKGLTPARLTLSDDLSIHYRGHPIENIAANARAHYDELLARQSKSLEEATVEYVRRYHRSPPPGFDTWYGHAVSNGLQLIDEFDSLMGDLEPFWGLSPGELRHRVDVAVKTGRNVIRVSVRDGRVAQEGGSDLADRMRTFERELPDLDLGLNLYDEPRVVVPHDQLVAANGACPDPQSTSLLKLDHVHFFEIAKQPNWELLTLSCSPDSPARLQDGTGHRLASQLSFLQNATSSKDVCVEPGYSELHGLFVSPASMLVTTALVPIFSVSRPSSFQDFMYPCGAYREEPYADRASRIPDTRWDEKTNKLFWTGSSTGGAATAENWRQMHRQRLALLMQQDEGNVTLLRPLSSSPSTWETYHAPMSTVAPLFNVSIHALILCDDSACEAQRTTLHLGPETDPRASYRNKYALDLDGNGWSGRFYRQLRSNSTVLKMTVFREWHDDWLQPWIHYVPVSLEMTELPEIMHFLAQTEQGQTLSRFIAAEGRRFAQSSLRDIDMDLYLYRTMLEYTRLLSDNREVLERRCPAPRVSRSVPS